MKLSSIAHDTTGATLVSYTDDEDTPGWARMVADLVLLFPLYWIGQRILSFLRFIGPAWCCIGWFLFPTCAWLGTHSGWTSASAFGGWYVGFLAYLLSSSLGRDVFEDEGDWY